jgi:hypothetical protein
VSHRTGLGFDRIGRNSRRSGPALARPPEFEGLLYAGAAHGRSMRRRKTRGTHETPDTDETNDTSIYMILLVTGCGEWGRCVICPCVSGGARAWGPDSELVRPRDEARGSPANSAARPPAGWGSSSTSRPSASWSTRRAAVARRSSKKRLVRHERQYSAFFDSGRWRRPGPRLPLSRIRDGYIMIIWESRDAENEMCYGYC